MAFPPHKSEQAEGMASYLDIHPLDGVIEIGGIWFGKELQRTRPATEALFLLLSYAMDDLGYRRMQWRCNSLNVKSRNAARRNIGRRVARGSGDHQGLVIRPQFRRCW